MGIHIRTIGIGICMLVTATPIHAEVIARCGASFGQGYYEQEGTWDADRISKGGFVFMVDSKGNPNIHFVDANGGVTDSAADGAKLSFTFIHADKGEFGILAVYDEAGVVETYNVIINSAGKRLLLWTKNRSMASPLAKVAAYVAACN